MLQSQALGEKVPQPPSQNGLDALTPSRWTSNVLPRLCETELMANKKTFPFEATLEKLEGIVETMESGDLSLEESLRAFEEGIQLTRACQQALSDAKQQIDVLIEKNGELTTEPMLDGTDGE